MSQMQPGVPSKQELAEAEATGVALHPQQEMARLVVPVLKAQLRNERRWCAWCYRLTPDHDLDMCKNCYMTEWSVGYCNRDCQKKGWKKGGHKQECGGKGRDSGGGGDTAIGEQLPQARGNTDSSSGGFTASGIRRKN